MKVTVNIDCTPEEARAFMGLPDVTPLNDAVVEEMTSRMRENLELLGPEALMRHWMNLGGQMQDQFLDLMRNASGGGARGK